MKSPTGGMQIPDTMTACIDYSHDGILKLPYFREVSHPFFTTHLKFSFPAPISK